MFFLLDFSLKLNCLLLFFLFEFYFHLVHTLLKRYNNCSFVWQLFSLSGDLLLKLRTYILFNVCSFLLFPFSTLFLQPINLSISFSYIFNYLISFIFFTSDITLFLFNYFLKAINFSSKLATCCNARLGNLLVCSLQVLFDFSYFLLKLILSLLLLFTKVFNLLSLLILFNFVIFALLNDLAFV